MLLSAGNMQRETLLTVPKTPQELPTVSRIPRSERAARDALELMEFPNAAKVANAASARGCWGTGKDPHLGSFEAERN